MEFRFDLTITFGVIVTLAIAIIGWIRSIRTAIDDRASAISARLDRHDHRLSTAEQTLQGMPGKDDLHDLRLALEGLRGDMREVRAAQHAAIEANKRQEIVVQRVEQYLLERK